MLKIQHKTVADGVIVILKGCGFFWQYIPKTHKRWGIKIHKLCDETAYTCDIIVYLGKNKAESCEGKSALESGIKKSCDCMCQIHGFSTNSAHRHQLPHQIAEHLPPATLLEQIPV